MSVSASIWGSLPEAIGLAGYVASLKRGARSSKQKGMMHLLWNLVFIEAHHGFHFMPRYIDTRANHLEDDLSRNRAISFLSKVPQASPQPTLVPRDLVGLLLDPQADWIFPQWREQFKSTLSRV